MAAVQSLFVTFFLLLGTLETASSFQVTRMSAPSAASEAFVDKLPSMHGKTVVVTGCSKGLGFVTALAAAKKGAEVFMLNRKSAKSKEAHAQIAEACTGPAPQTVECDLIDFSSVRQAAAAVTKASPEGVDVLCCNAGVMLQPDEASKDGYDITISTNVLSHFLLARELMPQLDKAASLKGEARIVSMSSASGFGAPGFNADFFTRRGGGLGGQRASYERYHQSKLGNLLFTSTLHDKLQAKSSAVKAIACHPGVCATDMFVHAQSVFNPGRPADTSRVPSAEEGALAQILCVCGEGVESGSLWGPEFGSSSGPGMRLPVEQPLSPPLVLVDEESKAGLWRAGEAAVGPFEV